MSKQIVFCADGTWQAPMNNTNVYRFFKGLTTSSNQVAFYDDGVGADGSGIKRCIQGADRGWVASEDCQDVIQNCPFL